MRPQLFGLRAVLGPPFARSGATRSEHEFAGASRARSEVSTRGHKPSQPTGAAKKRNERMTQQIEAWLTGKERMFVVLGAGHFVGKDGIVAHLRRDGWVPQRI